MDVENPQFEVYEQRFRALAEKAEYVKVAQPSLSSAQHYLCLYGENGLAPEEEFEILTTLETMAHQGLKRLEVDASYWQDTVLFIP